MPSSPCSNTQQPQPSKRALKQLAQVFRTGPQAQAHALALALTARFPNHGFGWKVLGVILLQSGCFAESVTASLRAIALLPHDASAHNTLGAAHLGLEQLDAAALCLRKALAIAPGYARAHFNLSKVLRAQAKLQEAQMHCQAALDSDPDYAAAHFGLGNLLELQNHIPQAIASYQTALRLEPGHAAMFSDMLHLMSHDVHTSAANNLAMHRAFGDRFEGALRGTWAAHPNSRLAERCIRVGFVSSDVYDHALANYLEPLFRLLNKTPDLQVHLYFTHAKEDAVTLRMRGYFRHWHDVADLSCDALEQRIRADAIDILIDVNGHTVLNRLLTFARKPAPIQMGWLGYLGTTGLQAMDYFVCDPYWIPPGQLDWQFLEKMAYLPCAVVFEPNPHAPAVNALPALDQGRISFGSFNRYNKINDAVIALWSLLMQRVPDSRLKLGGIPEDHRAALSARFEAQGVLRERLTFFDRTVQTEYLGLHHQIDFCLDTFPFCGGATSAHAAWMGVPTLTLAGELPASRLGATEMHHLGLDAFVANTIEDFLAKGQYWATHVHELAQLRAGMRERFSQSALGQTAAFADHFEAMLRSVWQRWCLGLPAASFQVEPTGNTRAEEATTEPPDVLLEALLNLHARQEFQQLEALARQLTHDYPAHGAGWKYLGSALRRLGRVDDALAVQRKAVALRPTDYEAHFNLAAELQQQGLLDEAVRGYLQALSLQPNNPAAYNNLANIFKLMGLFAQAEGYCRQALALKPDMAIAVNNLGNALHAQGKLQEAETRYREALVLKPDWAEAYNNLAICLKDQGYGSEAKEAYKKALSLKSDWAAARSNLLFSLSLDVHTLPPELHAEHLAFGALLEPQLQAAQRAHSNDRRAQRPLQVGFVSGDLYDHAMASFLEPLFAGLATQSELTLHAYYTHIYEDAATQRMRASFHAWNKVAELSDDALAAKIRSDQIDILIDLSGHTAHNRLLTFARKPAPVQASYLGYLGTTGLQSMDYFVCDAFWVPPAELDWQFTEKMAYLPGAVVFEPSAHAAPVNALPALTNGHLTFGSFNRPNKLNPSVIALWSMLLHALPTSRMVLGGIAREQQEALFRRFVENGVDIKRLTFFPRSNIQEYLALHQQVDFCLDTFPYGGGATNAHAAWMGVPTLCLAGESPASRFGAAEMHTLGLDAFIAHGIDEWVAQGVYWAQHLPELAQLRAGMRARFLASPMGQPRQFAEHFTALLRAMWQRWCSGLRPDTLGHASPGRGGDRQAHAHAHTRAQTQAIAADPAEASWCNNQGVVLLSQGRAAEAESALRQAIALRPQYGRALVNLATALQLQGQTREAESLCRQALQLDATDAAAHIQLGNALEAQGQASQAQACYYKADMAHEPRRAVAHSNVLYLMSHDVLVQPRHLLQEHQAFGEAFEAPLQAQRVAHANERRPDKVLQLGFVSSDFCHHALRDFLEPVFRALARRPDVTLWAYTSGTLADDATRRLRAHFAHWADVRALSDEALAAQIRADGIDVLLDLSGHTARNRLLTFARKPAPVQASYLGYLGTTGMRCIDYFLCDPFWVPPGQLDWQFTEQMAYMPHAAVFELQTPAPDVNTLPALHNGHITFGSFNRRNKLNASVIALWSLLLQAVPTARLLIGAVATEHSADLLALFAHNGVGTQRLTLHPRTDSAHYLALHQQVDLCLDTFPHGGGATTANAAWMGVPTLCLAGESPASRFSAALMHTLQLDGFIAGSVEAFVSQGCYWAQHVVELAQLRATLRTRFLASPLGQPQVFADTFAALLRRMWSRWCDGLAPSQLGIAEHASPQWESEELPAGTRQELLRPLHAPYYVYAPPFRETSGGIRAMHYICHALNLAGEEAYVVSPTISSALRTPVLTEGIRDLHAQRARQPIVIYPEVVADNPMKLRHVVRYLLNVPGRINPRPIRWLQSDLIYSFCKDIVPPSMEARLLEVPLINRAIFNQHGCAGSARQGRLVFINRYLAAGGTLQPATAQALEISFRVATRTPEELSRLYQTAELLYTYEHSTACYEAMLCGCPVVYLRNDLSMPEMPQGPLGREGWAWGDSPEQIAFAKNTVHQVDANYRHIELAFWSQLASFISITQERVHQPMDDACSALLFASKDPLDTGIRCFELGELEPAMQHLLEALAIDPNDALPYAYLAFICAAQAMDDKAQNFMGQALHLAPERIDLVAALGETYLLAGAAEKAVPYLSQAIQTQPRLFAAYPAYAQALRLSGQLTAAIELLQNAPCDATPGHTRMQALLDELSQQRDALQQRT